MSNGMEGRRAIYNRYPDPPDGARPVPEFDEGWLLVNEPFPSNPLNINRVLREDGREFSRKLLSGDIKGLRGIIQTAIGRIARESREGLDKARTEMEVVLDRLEEFRRETVADLMTVDLMIGDFPQITRDGLALTVRGKLAVYEIDLLRGHVFAHCHGQHLAGRFICITADGRLHEIGASDIRNERMRRAVQKALCLSDDLRLRDGVVYDSLRQVVMCPWCHLEGKLRGDLVEDLADRLRFVGDARV